MRIVIMGAGGLGGYFGARLAAAGNDVAFVARGAHLAAIRQDGLRVTSALGDLHLRDVAATDDPSALAPADVVIIGVKLWDTEAAAIAVKPLLRPGTAVVSFQNGVGKDDVLAGVLGREAVVGGVGQIGVAIASPGVIAHTGTMAKLIFGELDNRRSARVEALLSACTAADIEAEIADDIGLAIWQKFVFLVGMSAVTSTMRSTIGPIRANPQARGFLLDVVREAVAVGRALGMALPEDYADRRMAFIEALPPQMTASMQGDLARGNRLELPWLSSAVVELGARAGVPTPLNRAVRDVLALYVNGAPKGVD
ncbi:MAG TPA: 2-dehydropantoate 2-reductase [Acetobacteraceae bacterium]|nr:2-dehydropantoate 2-reductase [Acetobacteraceae bacterium]